MDNTFAIISSLNKFMAEYIIKELEKRGIQDLVVSHGTILLALHYNDELNYKELSSKIDKSPQTMTTLIKKLLKENYIEHKENSIDKRNKLVKLTSKGKEVIPLMMDISKDLYDIQYNGFNDKEIKEFRDYLLRISNNVKGE